MKYSFFNEREFENRTGLSFHMQAFAKQQIQYGEKLVFNIAYQDKNNENIYTATYDVLNNSGDTLYCLTIKLDIRTNDYSFVKSDIR